MNRRGFLSLFASGVASIALEQAIPLGRVWSFPKKIVLPWHEVEIRDIFTLGSVYQVRMPQLFILKRVIDKHLYEIEPYPELMPFRIIDAKIIEVVPPDSSRTPS